MNQIGADEISMLMGTIQALKDGDTTVDELMKPIRDSREAKNERLNELANQAAASAKVINGKQPQQKSLL